MELRFDSAKKRYGTPRPRARKYQVCSSGLVDASTKYGAPTVITSKPRIRTKGSEPSAGFQNGPGIIGSATSVATSRPQ